MRKSVFFFAHALNKAADQLHYHIDSRIFLFFLFKISSSCNFVSYLIRNFKSRTMSSGNVAHSVLAFCPPPFRRKAEGHSFRHSVLPSP